MRKWSKEIKQNLSTPDEPSSRMIAESVEHRSERRHRSTALKASKKEAVSSTDKLFEQLVKMSVMTMVSQQQYQQRIIPPLLSFDSSQRPAPSNPVRSNTDSSDILYGSSLSGRYIDRYAAQQSSMMEICKKLINEDWELDNLRTESKGGAITSEIWERYGFKIGTLAKSQNKISEFKHARCSDSSASLGSTDDDM